MSDITISSNPPDLAQRLQDPPRFLRRFARVLDTENAQTVGHISVRRIRIGGPFPPDQGVLGYKSGEFRKRLRWSKASVVGDGVVSSIGSNLSYAGIHEFGGTTKPHVIEAKNGKALRFGSGAKVLFRRRVKHPGSKIPARRPIFRGIEDRLPAYQAALAQATTDHLEGKTP